MPKVASSIPVAPRSTTLRMEDRKRAAGAIDDLAPPTKRHQVNGTKKESSDDMPWKDSIELYQKDAIYRQMLEYKREKTTLESQLRDIQKRATDHDDHLRVVDLWWTQLLEEVTLLAKNVAPEPLPDITKAAFPTAVRFKNSAEFTEHLAKKSKEIKSRMAELFQYIASASGHRPDPSLESLQKSLTTLLASQKEQLLKFDSLRTEKEDLADRLETASFRYLKAEKKIDRLKSEPVAKLEAQAIANGTASGNADVDNADAMAGVETSQVENEATNLAYREAKASLDKQAEQLERLAEENKGLMEQLTAANMKLTNLSDDDYARTDLFKSFRNSHEDLIKRINHLESVNIQLREEAEKSQSERTAVKLQLESESDNMRTDLESQLQRLDADLTRIRSARDELIADQTTRKAHQDQEKSSVEQLKEENAQKQMYAEHLEEQVKRLTSQLEAKPLQSMIDDMSHEDVRSKYIALQSNYEQVTNELNGFTNIYKRNKDQLSAKVKEFVEKEERIAMLTAEKMKADQKYFAARKDFDTRITEIQRLRSQNAKSSEIVSQLKDVESSLKNKTASLERELSELRASNSILAADNRKASSANTETTSKFETLQAQVSELKNMLKAKDGSTSSDKQRLRSLELEHEKLQVRCEQALKDKETWKQKSYSNASPQEEEFRRLALCDVCKTNFKDTAIKSCGHLFCKSCVDDRIANRMRKCPNCAKPFDKLDVMAVHM